MTEFSQTYWNDLLEKYKAGTITENDRFKLEKQAMGDPFLFDALEGFSLYQDVQQEEKKATKLFTFPRMAIAASLVILVTVIFNLKSNLNTPFEEDKSFAMVLEDGNATSSETADVDNIVDSNQNQEDSEIATEVPIQDEAIKLSKTKKNKGHNNVKGTTNTKVEVEEVIPPVPAKDKEVNSSEIVNADIEYEEEIVSDTKERKLADVNNSGNGLGVDMAVEKEKNAVEIVNANNFENKLDASKSEIVPLNSQSKRFEENSDNLNKKAKTVGYFEAVPVIGKEIFDDFAKQRIDERGLRQEKPQKVTIEFTIDKNGNLSNFHHIFTGCSECGPFAIDILKRSGEWKTVPSGFSGKARYTFIF